MQKTCMEQQLEGLHAKKGFICDMDGDGAITSIDALLVFRKAMGIE